MIAYIELSSFSIPPLERIIFVNFIIKISKLIWKMLIQLLPCHAEKSPDNLLSWYCYFYTFCKLHLEAACIIAIHFSSY